MNYDNRRFKPISNSKNGLVSIDMIFHYKQNDLILSCTYSGKKIKLGHILGLVDTDGNIEMTYQQINNNGELMTGKCQSTPEVLPNGKIRLHEKWQWTSGDCSSGESILEEI
jgi:hypothetical protein